jgi:hypothetical protein
VSTMPNGISAIDLMLNIPGVDNSEWYSFMKPLLLDKESREQFEMPAQYMFRHLPKIDEQDDYVAYTIEQMDTHGIERAMLGIDDENEISRDAITRYPRIQTVAWTRFERFNGCIAKGASRQ